MRRIREEIGRQSGPTVGDHPEPSWTEFRSEPHVPPPDLLLTPLNPAKSAKFEEIFAGAQKRNMVNRLIPSFLRGLFRKQGGFNRRVLDLAGFLMREIRELSGGLVKSTPT